MSFFCDLPVHHGKKIMENVYFLCIVEMFFPHDVKLPDALKGIDYFTTISNNEGKTYWHHRELIRYKYGKSKKLDAALDFIESKYKELHELLEPLQKDLK